MNALFSAPRTLVTSLLKDTAQIADPALALEVQMVGDAENAGDWFLSARILCISMG